MSEIIVSTAEAAKRLGLTAGTLAKWRTGLASPLPFVRLSPRKVGYAVSALDDFVRQRRFTSTKDYAPAA